MKSELEMAREDSSLLAVSDWRLPVLATASYLLYLTSSLAHRLSNSSNHHHTLATLHVWPLASSPGPIEQVVATVRVLF